MNIRSEISDNADPRVQTDTNPQRHEVTAAFLGFFLEFLVEHFEPIKHVERRCTCVDLMVLVVQWRVPERHDRVAHVFVDRSLARENCVGQRREKTVHQRGQTLGIVPVGFRYCRETPDIAQHEGHFALFATEHQPFR